MNNYKIDVNEGILYEGIINTNINKNINLIITSKKLIFQKEKGIFKKYLKVIDEILIDDIVLYKNKAQVKQKKNKLIIQTVNNKIIIECKSKLETTKIKEIIYEMKTGSNIIERATNSTIKTVGRVTGVIGGTAVASGLVLKSIKDSKKITSNVKEIAKLIASMLKLKK